MTALPQEAILSTLAEMSMAVVGFSLVAEILRPQSRGDERRLVTLRGVAMIGLMSAVMSAFPLVTYSYGLSMGGTWRLSSGIFLVWAVAGIAADLARLGRALPAILKQSRLMSLVVTPTILVNLCLLATNILAPSPSSGARYSTVLTLALAQAGFMFVWATFNLSEGGSAA